MKDSAPTSVLRALVASALGREPVHWYKPHTGLSAARRFVVRFADGSSAFVKAAVDDLPELGCALPRPPTMERVALERDPLTAHAAVLVTSRAGAH